MNSTRITFASLVIALGLGSSAALPRGGDDLGGLAATTYDLSWNTIDGGGGASTGGTFTLTGTIGQHDAGGPFTGGTYSLVGGFWGGGLTGASCTGDTNGSNAVDVNDLLAVVSHWGACPAPCPPPCVGDIAPAGGNCAVDVNDLLAVVSHWGACP